MVKDIEKTGRIFESLLGGEGVYNSGDKLHSLDRQVFYLIGIQWIALMEDENMINRSYHHVAFRI